MHWMGWIYIIASQMILMGTHSVDAISCQKSEYQTGDECCPLCDPGLRVGEDCTEFTSTTCVPCTEGTYTDKHNGLKECHTCSTCDEESGLNIKEPCNSSADAVCEPLEGFFCLSFTSGSCSAAQRHRSCKPGQFISKTGTWSSDAECSDCSSGTFSDGSSTSCQPHTQCGTLNLQLIEAGTASADAQCGERPHVIGVGFGIVFGYLVIVLFIDFILDYKSRIQSCLKTGEKSPNIRTEQTEQRASDHQEHDPRTAPLSSTCA